MAEVTSLAVRNIPNSCIIGERTTGAMGILGYEYSTYYSGTFGDEDGPHYCYMSDHLNRTLNGEVLEGIGVTPDISLKFNLAEVTEGNDTWMDRAISYIQNGN
jgi:C-terminal processing protease CtpA/Prc